MNRIAPYPLWLGHAGDGRDTAHLWDAGIRAVVQLAVDEPVLALPREFLYLRVPLVDSGDNEAEWVRLAMRVIGELIAGRTPTLVYCSAGASRTPCLAAAGLALAAKVTPAKALEMIAEQHGCDVSPALWALVVEVWRGSTM